MRLTTVGEACRTTLRETPGKTLAWVVAQVQCGQNLSQIKAHLMMPEWVMCHEHSHSASTGNGHTHDK